MSDLKFYEIKGDQPDDHIAVYEDSVRGDWVKREDAEQLQQRNAELDIECEARQRYTCRLLTERNELAAHVDRVKRYARESSGYEPSLSALYRMIEEETPQQSLNALKRDVARDAYNQAIFDLWDKICTEGMSGKDVVCWGENSATQYANTKYPTEGE